MKTSILLFLTDILPHKRKLLNKLVKNKLFDNLSQDEVFGNFKKHGIDGIELLLPTNITAEMVEEVKHVVEKNNLKIFSIHQALRFVTKTRIKEIVDLLETAKALSAKVVVLHMNSAGKQLFDKKYIEKIHVLQEEYAVKIGFENREKYLGSILDGYGWDEKEFGELMEKEDLNITFDVCHMGQSGGDIIKFFKKHKNRIVNVHLSDYKSHYLNSSLRPIRYKHLPLGKGDLPIQEFLKVLREEKYDGLLTLETNTDYKELIGSANMIRNGS
jgi:sugar phosphate isomerase/epimerase